MSHETRRLISSGAGIEGTQLIEFMWPRFRVGLMTKIWENEEGG